MMLLPKCTNQQLVYKVAVVSLQTLLSLKTFWGPVFHAITSWLEESNTNLLGCHVTVLTPALHSSVPRLSPKPLCVSHLDL